MFFDDLSQIKTLATNTGFSIFVLPSNQPLDAIAIKYFPRSIVISPDNKNKIKIDSIRELTELSDKKTSREQFFVIRQAETMNDAAMNALLKCLEEPKPHHHFVLLVYSASTMLPTIMSRAKTYTYRQSDYLKQPVNCPPEIKDLAKTLITATPPELISLGETISKKRDQARPIMLDATKIAIELLYKSYLETKNPRLLQRLPKLIKLHYNLANNGHIKLHILADLC